MATSLIENLSDHFEPGRYTDDYKTAFQQLLEQKVQGVELTAQPSEPPAAVTDLMAALKASVEATRQRKREPVPAAAEGKTRVKVAAKTAVTKAARPAARRRTA
jgi:DNA end-binding protein Ku